MKKGGNGPWLALCQPRLPEALKSPLSALPSWADSRADGVRRNPSAL